MLSYIDYECIKGENSFRSPFGEFEKAYVVVIYTGNDYGRRINIHKKTA